MRLRSALKTSLFGVIAATAAHMIAALLAYPKPAAATTALPSPDPACVCRADFSHDGTAAHATIASVAGRSIVRVFLSGRRKPLELAAGSTRVLGIVATDVDRDGKADLVALKKNLRLRVWLNKGHGRFVRKRLASHGAFFRRRFVPRSEREPSSAFVFPEDREQDLKAFWPGKISDLPPPQLGADDAPPLFLFPARDAFLSPWRSRGPPPISS